MQIHGSCHCGTIHYEAIVNPDKTTICHCTDCQKLTGSAYRVSVPAEKGSFHLLKGTPTIYIKIGDSGARRAQAFCPTCGSSLYVYDADNPNLYGLRVGCIEESALLIPQKQKWYRSVLKWTQNLEKIERQDKE
ncbi:MAG: GFA family protein [Alphaproteobacteria bacterium]|nr:GFA family protein [Alphaproteobacteria bacterium]